MDTPVEQKAPEILSDQYIPNLPKNSPIHHPRHMLLLFLVAIVLVAIAGGMGYIYLFASKQQTRAPVIRSTPTILPTQAVSITPPIATTSAALWKPICDQQPKNITTLTIHQGDGTTNIARRAILSYLNVVQLAELQGQSTLTLSPEEEVFAEDYIRKNFTFPTLTVGESIEIPCTVVENAALRAKILTIGQTQNLKQYSSTISDYQLQQIVKDASDKYLKNTPVKTGVIFLGN